METAVENAVGFRFLDIGCYEFSPQFNKVSHRMLQPELIDTLRRLKAAGLISFGQFDERGEIWTEVAEVQFDEALHEGKDGPGTSYRLTNEGGRQWELFASPRWNYFLHQDDCWDTVEGTDETPRIGIFTSVDLKWLKKMVNLISNAFRRIDLEAVEYLEIGAWDATYWKVLPTGYRAKVTYVGNDHFGLRPGRHPRASAEEMQQEIAVLDYWLCQQMWHRSG
ncbi:MAG: hypothetical protein JWN70_6669 [Planctomycetaceae bacterium]|nr:hypothetical protein [Planctomycetaceae bacterium]